MNKHKIPFRTKRQRRCEPKTDQRGLALPHRAMDMTMRVYAKKSYDAISQEVKDKGIHYMKSSVEALCKRTEARMRDGRSMFDLSI